jgi:hypothetical protein
MACWAHARRKVYEHHESDPQVSALPLALINQLYDIERRAMKMSDQERGELRAKESRRILDRLGEYLEGPASKSDAIRPIRPSCKLRGGECARSFARANNTSKRSDAPVLALTLTSG